MQFLASIFNSFSKLSVCGKIKKSAFTLAEVLITLGIVGIVAEMTIPDLVQSFQEKVLVTQYKKAYSVLNQVYSQILANEGSPTGWPVASEDDIARVFIPYLQVAQTCLNNGTNCYVNMGYKNAHIDLRKKAVNVIMDQIKLKDGMILSFEQQVTITGPLDCKMWDTTCFFMQVDVNGTQSPNRYGVDTFTFEANDKIIFPRGSFNSVNFDDVGQLCNPAADTGSPGWWNGTDCGSWVSRTGNMDYLKCIDGGQTSYCHMYQ